MFSYPVANVIKIPQTALPEFNDFCSYLEHSLRNPFVLDLKDYNLIGVLTTPTTKVVGFLGQARSNLPL